MNFYHTCFNLGTSQPTNSYKTAMANYPMARSGGLFLILIGAALLCAILFSGRALVSYNIFFVGAALAVVSLLASSRFSVGSPSSLQIAALAFAISLEVILFIALVRNLPPATPEPTRWLWVSIVVGIHFLPMALSFGPRMLLLGLACIADGVVGLLLPNVAFEFFGTIDGFLKLGIGFWLFRDGVLFRSDSPRTNRTVNLKM